MVATSDVCEALAGPIIVADEVRDRRVFLECALRCAGYGCVSASCGMMALRLARQRAATLLVTHVGVRCGDVPLAFAIRRERASIAATRVLAFTRRRSVRVASSHRRTWCDAIVHCTRDLFPVVNAVERLLGPPRASRMGEPDLLMELMLLDDALGMLPEWWLPGWD